MLLSHNETEEALQPQPAEIYRFAAQQQPHWWMLMCLFLCSHTEVKGSRLFVWSVHGNGLTLLKLSEKRYADSIGRTIRVWITLFSSLGRCTTRMRGERQVKLNDIKVIRKELNDRILRKQKKRETEIDEQVKSEQRSWMVLWQLLCVPRRITQTLDAKDWKQNHSEAPWMVMHIRLLAQTHTSPRLCSCWVCCLFHLDSHLFFPTSTVLFSPSFPAQ